MNDSFDADAVALGNPTTDATTLGDIAARRPDLWPHIANHPNVYWDLLNWLGENGDDATRGIVAARLGVDQPAAPAAPAAAPAANPPEVLGEQSYVAPKPTGTSNFQKQVIDLWTRLRKNKPLFYGSIAGLAVVLLVAGVAIAATHPSRQQSSADHGSVTTPSATPTDTPVSYPIPDGCPSASDFGGAFATNGNGYESVSLAALNSAVATALPDGGCGYADKDTRTSSNSSSQYRNILVWYFNLGSPGKQTRQSLGTWATSAGSTDSFTAQNDVLSLPSSFSTWTGSRVVSFGGPSLWQNPRIMPAYVQGTSAYITFALDLAKVATLVQATQSGATITTTNSLSLGIPVQFSASFPMQDTDGYTVQVDVTGSMQPFTKSIADSKPGYFSLTGSAAIGSTVTNTTQGRNTQSGEVEVLAIYPSKSSVCGTYNPSLTAKNGAQFCYVSLGNVVSESLPAGSNKYTAPTARSLSEGTFLESSDVLSQANSPTSIYALVGFPSEGWTSSTGCKTVFKPAGAYTVSAVPMTGWPDILCN